MNFHEFRLANNELFVALFIALEIDSEPIDCVNVGASTIASLHAVASLRCQAVNEYAKGALTKF